MDLKHIKKIFPSEKDCIKLLEDVVWGSEIKCPYCSNTQKEYAITNLNDRYHCNWCNSSFSVTVKTIFARTRCDLRKWFLEIYLLYPPKDKITVRDLAEKIQTTKDTARLLKTKIQKAIIETPDLLEKIVFKINQLNKCHNEKKQK